MYASILYDFFFEEKKIDIKIKSTKSSQTVWASTCENGELKRLESSKQQRITDHVRGWRTEKNIVATL